MDNIDARPPISKATLEYGGMRMSLKAHAICASCTNCQDYLADPEAVSLEQFGTAAVAAFRDSGWRICVPNLKTLCPTCADAAQDHDEGICRECLVETWVRDGVCDDCRED